MEKLVTILADYFATNATLDQLKKKHGKDVVELFEEHNVDLSLFQQAEEVKLFIKEIPLRKQKKQHYKTCHHTTWFGQKIVLRSSYEKEMVKKLDKWREMYYYECMRIPYRARKRMKNYIPDFYLPQYNVILEVKGEHLALFDKNTIRLKEAAVESYGFKYKMLTLKQIQRFSLVSLREIK